MGLLLNSLLLATLAGIMCATWTPTTGQGHIPTLPWRDNSTLAHLPISYYMLCCSYYMYAMLMHAKSLIYVATVSTYVHVD